MEQRIIPDNMSRSDYIIILVIRLAVIAGSVGMILWYLESGYFSIGNIAGIAFFSLVILAAALWRSIYSLKKRLEKSRGGRALIIAICALAAAFIVYVMTALALMIFGSMAPVSDDSTVVVLGCQVRGTEPSLTLRKRLDAAYDYLVNNPETNAVLSGGKGSGEEISEAQCMYEYLTGKGIAPDRLYLEDRSTTTNENIKFSKKIIEENGLAPDLAIVTDWYHEFRAAVIAHRAGCRSGAVSAPTAGFITAHLVTREMIAIPFEIIFKN